MSNPINVGIIGYGFVGQAVHASLNSESVDIRISIHDTNNKIKSSKFFQKNEQDFIFVCVNSPKDDYGDLQSVLDDLSAKDYSGIVVIKTTVPYTVLKSFIEGTNLKVVFNPEFLDQNSFIDDAIKQQYIVLGGEYALTKEVEDLYNCTELYHNNLTFKHTSIENAINFKYTRNILGAYKVLFWEFIQDRTGNARLMSDMLVHMPQGHMNQVGMDGERGYGGACFPKDVVNFNSEEEHALTKFLIETNKFYNSN